MKKTTIGVLIAAGVMIVAGIGLCIGGVMAAGGVEAAKAALYGSDVGFDYVFEIDEDGFEIDFDNDNLPKVHHTEEHHTDGTTVSEKQYVLGNNQATYGAEDVRSLELEIGAAKVEIVESSLTKDIFLQTEGKFQIYVKNGVLHVKSGNDLEKHTMLLEIPENTVFEKVEIKGNACELEIYHIEARELDVEADAGFVFIENMKGDKAEFEIGAGEIVVNDGSVQECDVNVGMGNFEYTGDILRHGDVECGMGNAELYLEGSEDDYNYEIDCAAGNVSVGDLDFGGIGEEKTINNHANATIEIDCSMGNVMIGF